MRKLAKLLMSVILICSFIFGCFVTSAEITNFDIKCPDYSFTILDGTTVTNTTNANKATVLIFFGTTCPNSSNLIKGLANANWVDNSKISIMAIEFNEANNTVLQTYSDTYGGKNIAFSSCEYSVTKSFLTAVGNNSSSVTLPIVFVVDGTNTIRSYSTGALGSAEVRRTLSKYVDGLTPEPASSVKITGTFDYSKSFDVLEIVNSQRAANGLSALKMDSVLLDAAMQRAAECSVYYSHTRPDGSDCMSVVDTNIFRENIAAGHASPTDAMNGWMNSDGHKNNILNTDCDSIGIGVFWQNGVYFWTQVFSNQLGTEETTEPSNETSGVSIAVLDSCFTFEASQTTLKLEKDKTADIYANLKQSTFTHTAKIDHENITYTSGNTAVATVSADGKVTAVGQGKTNITVSLKDSQKTATVEVEVTLPATNDDTTSKNENTSSEQTGQNNTSDSQNTGSTDSTSSETTSTPETDTTSQDTNTGVTSQPESTDTPNSSQDSNVSNPDTDTTSSETDTTSQETNTGVTSQPESTDKPDENTASQPETGDKQNTSSTDTSSQNQPESNTSSENTSNPSNTDSSNSTDGNSSETTSSGDESTDEIPVIFESEDVTVKGAEDVFEKDTILEVNKLDGVTPPTALTDIAAKYVMFDIVAMNNNVSVQPNGKLLVTFNIPNDFEAKNLSLVSIDENNQVTVMSFVVDETANTVTTELESLGKYAIIEVKQTEHENVVSVPEKDITEEPPVEKNNNTALIIIIVAIILLLSVGGFGVWYFLIYKKKNTIENIDEI